MLYRLIILNGAQKGERHSVGIGPLVIGSGPDCSFRLEAADVAREHARVEASEQGLYIRDLGTVNRILVNRREVSESLLKHGDTVEIGAVDLLVQACLEADISGGPRLPSARPFGGRVYVLLAIAAVLAWFVLRRPAAPPAVPAPVVVAVPEPPPVPVPTPAPEPVPVPAPGPDAAAMNGAVTEELKQLRQALADLQKTVQERTKDEPPPALPAKPPEETAADAERRIAQREMAFARAAVESESWEEAHARLDVILANRPGDVEAMTWKAVAYERQGQLEKAVGVWSRILVLSGGAERTRAEGERDRLTQEVLRARKPQPRYARLGRILIHKFPDSEEYDEMRLLHIEVERMDSDWKGELRLQVAFFDRSRDGRILLSRAVGSKDRLELAGDIEAGTLRSEATYLVPRNARKREAAGPAETYYGYVVRLWVDGRVEDEIARPESLLNASAPAVRAPATPGGS
jgi:tetratricopeptide (TPR) repeat protein